jgi:hypothetical protein
MSFTGYLYVTSVGSGRDDQERIGSWVATGCHGCCDLPSLVVWVRGRGRGPSGVRRAGAPSQRDPHRCRTARVAAQAVVLRPIASLDQAMPLLGMALPSERAASWPCWPWRRTRIAAGCEQLRFQVARRPCRDRRRRCLGDVKKPRIFQRGSYRVCQYAGVLYCFIGVGADAIVGASRSVPTACVPAVAGAPPRPGQVAVPTTSRRWARHLIATRPLMARAGRLTAPVSEGDGIDTALRQWIDCSAVLVAQTQPETRDMDTRRLTPSPTPDGR